MAKLEHISFLKSSLCVRRAASISLRFVAPSPAANSCEHAKPPAINSVREQPAVQFFGSRAAHLRVSVHIIEN